MKKILLLDEDEKSSEDPTPMDIDKDVIPPKLQMPLEQNEEDETQMHPRISGRKRARKPSSKLKDYYVYSVQDIINESDDPLNYKKL